MPRPLILLSNDDGVHARGLAVLGEALSVSADVVVCAPASEQSATSHALTLHRPLRLSRVGEGVFALDGTPADCVYVALHSGTRVLPRRPDLVVSGMNHGLNLGSDVFYSGTVAAAREGALRGIPSVAVSADLGADRAAAARIGATIALELLAGHDPRERAPLLNVNVPPGAGWPIEATRLGMRLYEDVVEFRRDPRGREYLWLGGALASHGESARSDTDAHDRGVVSITPLLLDLTAEVGAPRALRVAEAAARASQDSRRAAARAAEPI